MQFTTGTRIRNMDRRENDIILWDAESVFVSLDLFNATYDNLEMAILYTNVSSNFGPIPANCSSNGLSVNCTLGKLPISLLFSFFMLLYF